MKAFLYFNAPTCRFFADLARLAWAKDESIVAHLGKREASHAPARISAMHIAEFVPKPRKNDPDHSEKTKKAAARRRRPDISWSR